MVNTGNHLEKKRPSITRLKPDENKLWVAFIYPWKEKTLDYEIETGLSHPKR